MDAISSPRSTKDFKTSPSYRLTGDLSYELVVPGSEIKSGEMGEVSVDNQLSSYAKIVHIPYHFVLNDDGGFFDAALRRALGRGAALSFAASYWAAFLSDPAFWSAANKNLISGSGSALDISSLEQAVQLLENQVDEFGAPCNITAAWLITSSENKIKGQRLCGDEKLTMTGSTDRTETTDNPFTHLQHASSTYLGNATIPNADAGAWWICADPDDTPTMEVLYLNGKTTPTISSAKMGFDTLGISFRAVHDWSAKLIEPMGSVKAAGK